VEVCAREMTRSPCVVEQEMFAWKDYSTFLSQYQNCLILELSIPNEILKPAAYWISLEYLKVFNLGLIVNGTNADIIEQCYSQF